jgi:XTP/dITP diphosphohydrolase
VRLVVATKNRHKLEELRAMLRGLPVEVEAVPDDWDVDEPWETFEENAAHKARAAAKAIGTWALADDSGLEVDALRGAPGVRSARYAGEPKDDGRNNAKLLDAMRDVPEDRRSARFRCVLALASPDGEVRSAAGACEGTVGFTPRGSGGFGYDPLFIVEGMGGKTMAELSAEEKNRISHRARAYAALRGLLAQMADSGKNQ